MIHLAQVRRAIEAAPGDAVGMTKDQALQLVEAAERGQRAERRLSLAEAVVGVFSHALRVPA